MSINKEEFGGISNKVKECLGVLSELPDSEKKQLAILMIAQTVSPKFAAEVSDLLEELLSWAGQVNKHKKQLKKRKDL